MSKRILDGIVENIKKDTELNQFLNTGSALQWFENIKDKKKRHFITGDIRNFYGEISEELLNKALDWAESFKPIPIEHREIILQVRKTFLDASASLGLGVSVTSGYLFKKYCQN